MGIGEVGELLRRSTVQIRSTSRRRPSAGSGVIWDREGTIVTNAHVISDGAHLVELWDGRSFPAEVQARDDTRDLAKLKLATASNSPATFRRSAVKPGELVIAVGNPLGFTGALIGSCACRWSFLKLLGRRRWVQASIRATQRETPADRSPMRPVRWSESIP